MKRLLLAATLFATSTAFAGSPAVYEKSVNQALDVTYGNVSKALKITAFASFLKSTLAITYPKTPANLATTTTKIN